MKQAFVALLVGLSLLVLQAVVFPFAFGMIQGWFGNVGLQTVDIFLLLMIYVAFHHTLWTSLKWALPLTALYIAMGSVWRGGAFVMFSLTAIFVSSVHQHILLLGTLSKMLLVFAVSFFSGVAYFLGTKLIGRDIMAAFLGWDTVLVQALVNALFADPIFSLFEKLEKTFFHDVRRRRQGIDIGVGSWR